MKEEIFADDINNAAANATNKLCELLDIDDNGWEVVYNKLLEVLSELKGYPEYGNYN